MNLEIFNRIVQNAVMVCIIAGVGLYFLKMYCIAPEPPTIVEPISVTVADEIPPLKNGLIDINTANSHQLQTLNGIGESKAKAIIDYRDEHGDFTSVEQLVEVSGIGEKILEQIRDQITV